MEKMAAESVSQKWWDICKPMQIPLETRKKENGGLTWMKYLIKSGVKNEISFIRCK